MYLPTKNYKVFTHESNTFLFKKYTLKHHSNQRDRKTPETSPSLGVYGPQSYTRMPEPTPLKTPNDSSIGSRTFNYATMVTMERPKFTPKLPVPLGDFHPEHPSIDRPQSPPKPHPDIINRFSTIHPPDRETDTPTDRWDRRQTCCNTGTRLRSIVL